MHNEQAFLIIPIISKLTAMTAYFLNDHQFLDTKEQRTPIYKKYDNFLYKLILSSVQLLFGLIFFTLWHYKQQRETHT